MPLAAVPGKSVLPALLAAVVLAAATLACGDTEGDTIVNVSDCGLIEGDLIGDWEVDFAPETAVVTDLCDGPKPASSIDVAGSPFTYTGVVVQVTGISADFTIRGDLGSTVGNVDLVAGIDAFTCQAVVAIWEPDDDAYVVCVGQFDRTSQSINVLCDSTEFDTDNDGAIDATCELDRSLSAVISVL